MTSPRVPLVPTAAAAALLLLSFSAPLTVRADVAEDARAVRPTQGEIDAEPENLSGGLRQLSAAARKATRVHAATPRARAALAAHRQATASRTVEDAAGRVVVDVRLRPGADPAATRAALESLGAEVFAEGTAGRPGDGGTLSARLATERAAEAAALPGVHSVALVRKPWRRVGRTTSQGAAAINSVAVNARGITGRGLTVGVLSDSYDLTAPHAAADVTSGDLPGRGNPVGHTTPVKVLFEASSSPDNADEGRAMLQIVHDVAPDANLVFATTGDTQTSFANNIRALRTAGCDVLVDDIGFPDEPFFSDSIVARAVDEVVTSTTTPGRPVAFYSAAGNEGGIGYEANFHLVPDANVRVPGAAVAGNLKLDQVPAVLTGGGFHNFNKGNVKGTGKRVVQQIIVSVDTAEIDLQWNDLPNAVTNDYKLLIFDADGNYLADLSDTSNAFSTGDVYKFSDLDPVKDSGDPITYQIAITRRTGSAGVANHFRYEVYTNGFVQSDYLQSNVPTIFGHSGARQVDAVGAVPYDQDQRISEDYSSLGPVSIYFDDNGNRLTVPEVRLQPTVAAPDNVNTTFFPPPAAQNDTDGDGFPNFSGTSAAAPHAAGAAALLLQAAGGPGSLSASQLRGLLAGTAREHDQSPFESTAAISDPANGVQLSLVAAGDGTNSSSYSTRFFNVTYSAGAAGSELRTLNIDLGTTGEVFDPSTDLGFSFTIGDASGGVNAAAVTSTLSASAGGAPNTLLSLAFAPGAFPVGGTLRFGIDRDDATINAGGNSADLLDGTRIGVKVTNPGGTPGKLKLKGNLLNDYGTGYSTAVGAGLIDVSAALDRLQGR